MAFGKQGPIAAAFAKAQAEGTLLMVVKVLNRKFLRHGFSPGELGFPSGRSGKGKGAMGKFAKLVKRKKPATKDEMDAIVHDLFTVENDEDEDTVIGPVPDEDAIPLVYDEDEDEDGSALSSGF